MKYRELGHSGLSVSVLSYGASALGNVYREIDDASGIATVHYALEQGINYIDVAPAYGGTKAEIVLGKALEGISRDSYYLSTKVGKYCNYGSYGNDIFDYSEVRIRQSLKESRERIGVDYFDIVFLHDIEYHNRKYISQALGEGVETLKRLKKEGQIGAFGLSTYPMDLWKKVVNEVELDVIMSHNHFCLSDQLILDLLPETQRKGIGIVNSSPLACGLLTTRGAANWHPASEDDKETVKRAVRFCQQNHFSLESLAVQYAVSHPNIPTTLTTSADKHHLKESIESALRGMDSAILAEVQNILSPIMNRDWNFGEVC